MTEDIVQDERAVAHLRKLYERDGKLTAESVLDSARSKRSPLHTRFEWNDTVAAHEYRLEQARQMIRLCVTVVEGQTVRAFVHVRSAGTYAPTEEVMATTDWRDEVLRDFRRDAAAFEKKWRAHKLIASEYAKWVASQS